MTIQLTEKQVDELSHNKQYPISVVDPCSSEVWYLIPATDYDAIQALLEEDREQKAIHAVGFRNAAARLRVET